MIQRYAINHSGSTTLRILGLVRLLTVGVRNGICYLWVEVDPRDIDMIKTIILWGIRSGEIVSLEGWTYLGSIISDDACLEDHIYYNCN